MYLALAWDDNLVIVVYFLALVVVALAAARLTALFLWDEITRPWREKKLAKHPPGTKIHKLLTCYWCAGFWASLLVVSYSSAVAIVGETAGWMPWGTLASLPVTVLAVAYAAPWILDMEKEREQRGIRAD